VSRATSRGAPGEREGRYGRVALLVALVAALVGLTPAHAATEYYRDTFDDGTFGGDDGTVSWSTDWLESEGDGPGNGAIQVRGGGHCASGDCLYLGDDITDATVERELDLDLALAADLSFTYEIHTHSDGAGEVRLSVSKSGSGSWAPLATYPLAADAGPAVASFNLLPYASPSTRIRFSVVGGIDDSHMNVDDLEVKYDKSDNQPPELDPVGDRSTAEGELLAFTATAGDPNAGDSLVFSLGSSAPMGASITSGGDFTWTPAEAQGPGSYTFAVVVTDDGTPPMSDSETITVTVHEVNEPPMLGTVGNRTVDEGTVLAFTATATDPDAPANTLSFSLGGSPPAGAAITTDGAFTWTPSEAQGPGSYTFAVTVTDDATPAMSDSETITVTVREVNTTPVLDPIGDKVVEQDTTLRFTAAADDDDLPDNGLVFSLAGAVPAGAAISPTGAFSWTPTEAQSPGTYTFDVVVTDDGVPARSDSETITVRVTDVNLPPVLGPLRDRTVSEEATLAFTATASDGDIPADSLAFSLAGGVPAGAAIDPATGRFTWTPTEAQGPGTYRFRVMVTDDAPVAKSDSASFTVTVQEVNRAPELAPIGDARVDEGQLLTFAAVATDPDLPANELGYRLSGAVPAGAAVSADGVITWTPADGKGGASYTFGLVVTDDGAPGLSDAATFTVTVVEANNPPLIGVPAAQSSTEGEDASLLISAADPEGDAIDLTVVGLPPGMTFDPVGRRISGTIAEGASAGSPYLVTVTATDDGSPPQTATATFVWIVARRNDPPSGSDRSVATDEDRSVLVALPGEDPEGGPITISLRRLPGNGTVRLDGGTALYAPNADWHGTDTFTYVVSDGTNESPAYTITVAVRPVNDPPVPADDAYEVAAGDTLDVPPPGLLGNDIDIDGDPLVVVVATDPAHGTLTVGRDGSFTYRPLAGYAGSDAFTYRVQDAAGEGAVARVDIEVRPLPASSPTRAAVVAEVIAGTAEPAPPSADSVPVLRRSLVLMSRATRASVDEMGMPFLLLLGVLAFSMTTGRLTLIPFGTRSSSHLGTVRVYEPAAGYGLVVRDDDGADVFVHRSAIRPRGTALRPGQRVRFTSVAGFHRDVIVRIRPSGE
jgi:cold shock CspA family protein